MRRVCRFHAGALKTGTATSNRPRMHGPGQCEPFVFETAVHNFSFLHVDGEKHYMAFYENVVKVNRKDALL